MGKSLATWYGVVKSPARPALEPDSSFYWVRTGGKAPALQRQTSPTGWFKKRWAKRKNRYSSPKPVTRSRYADRQR